MTKALAQQALSSKGSLSSIATKRTEVDFAEVLNAIGHDIREPLRGQISQGIRDYF